MSIETAAIAWREARRTISSPDFKGSALDVMRSAEYALVQAIEREAWIRGEI